MQGSLTGRTVREVFEDHLERRQAGDVEGDIARNYASDAVVLCGDGVLQGHHGVREASRRLHELVPNATYRYRTVLTAGEMAFLEWEAEGDGVRVDDGVDSFLIRDGHILVQTIHYTPVPARRAAGGC